MPIRLKHFSWNEPFLLQAARELVLDFGADGLCDISGVALVLPSKRATRLLENLLFEECERQNLPLIGQQFITLGQLPELLYPPSLKSASKLEQRLAWGKALASFSQHDLSPLFPLEERLEQFTVIDRLADQLCRLWTEVSAGCVRFSDVPKRAAGIDDFAEEDRWKLLESIRLKYLKTLEQQGLEDLFERRLKILEKGETASGQRLCLIGVVEMPLVLKQLLKASSVEIVSFVFCSDGDRETFDEFGCLQVEHWSKCPIPIDEKQIKVAQNDTAQSRLAVERISELSPNISQDDLALVVTNEALIPYLNEQIVLAGAESRSASGRPASETRPVTFLRLLQQYISSERYQDLAALARHPDLLSWIVKGEGSSSMLHALDQSFEKRLPALVRVVDSKKDDFEKILTPLRRLLSGFDQEQKLVQWSHFVRGMLLEIYSDLELDQELSAALKVVGDVLIEIEQSGFEIESLSASDALIIILGLLDRATVATEQHGQEIEILGWLELVLDDSPHVVVVGMNEQDVPASITSDVFLPNSLRSALGLLTNDQRLARDAYVAKSLLFNRESVVFTAARTRGSGEPLLLSRLMLREPVETAAGRVGRYFENEASELVSAAKQDVKIFYERPAPMSLPALSSMPVTSFRAYLRCPYRFYLQYVLKLREAGDSANELEPMQFGTFAHEILSKFSETKSASSTDVKLIEKELMGLLEKEIKLCFTRPVLPSVRVQLEQLRSRIVRFAQWQSDWVAQGWEIVHSELGYEEGDFALSLPEGEKMYVTGRIDRVDRNSKSGAWAVFDYKTSEMLYTPEDAHRIRGEWCDFQLPLYASMLKTVGVENPMLGYIPLPRESRELEPLFANWNSEELQEALEIAGDIALAVRQNRFSEVDLEPRAFDSFSAICGTNVLSDDRLEEGA